MSTTRPNCITLSKNCTDCINYKRSSVRCNEKRFCNGSLFVLDKDKEVKEEEFRILSKDW
jgi:hypothetical protein